MAIQKLAHRRSHVCRLQHGPRNRANHSFRHGRVASRNHCRPHDAASSVSQPTLASRRSPIARPFATGFAEYDYTFTRSRPAAAGQYARDEIARRASIPAEGLRVRKRRQVGGNDSEGVHLQRWKRESNEAHRAGEHHGGVSSRKRCQSNRRSTALRMTSIRPKWRSRFAVFRVSSKKRCRKRETRDCSNLIMAGRSGGSGRIHGHGQRRS